jgi:LytS/YehU family sensor histidine kinase
MAYVHHVHRLHAQMNPYFLFNALNAVVAFRHSPDDVARVAQGRMECRRARRRSEW